MTLSEIFKRLGAPLINTRWSWGAVRVNDGVVFLRVWQDRKIRLDGHWYMMLTHHERYIGDENSLGYKERLDHVKKIRQGSCCYMIMCCAVNTLTTPRKIKSFNSDEVFLGGQMIEHEGDSWIELLERRSIKSVQV